MTTLDALTRSLESSEPIEVYQIDQGLNTFRYTADGTEFDLGGGVVYQPVAAIGRDKIMVGGKDSSKRIVKVTLPASNTFVQQYFSIIPAQRALVTISRLQRGEQPSVSTLFPLYQGVVQSVSFPSDTEIAHLNVQSFEAAYNRSIPKFTYASGCQHFLFDQGCKVDPGLHTLTSTVSAETTVVLTVPGLTASGRNYVGGFCGPTDRTDFRTIIAVSGDDITIQLPFASSVLNVGIRVFPVCDHDIFGDCGTTYANTEEYGGVPFVPDRNPFQDGIDE